MADPFTIAGMALSAGGGLISAFGQKSAGEAAQKQYAYKAGIAQMNRQIALKNSEYTMEATGRNVERMGMQAGQTIGTQKAIQAGSGFDVNTGSAADVRDTTRRVGMIDQDTVRRAGDIKALGFRNRASTLEAEATGDIMAGEASKKAGGISALGTLVGTAGSVASKWSSASTSFGSSGGTGITTYGPDQEVTGWMA